MDVGHITVDEACGLPHTFGCVFGDRLNEFETKRGEAVDEIVVGSELEMEPITQFLYSEI